MHKQRARQWLMVGLAVIASLGVGWLVSEPASASLGYRGVPVYGRLSGPVPMEQNRFVQFYTPDGSLNGTDTVPVGKYLVVTDIVLTPDAGTDTSCVVSVELTIDGTGRFLRLRNTDTQVTNLHFSMPMFVLSGGQKLKASNAWFSTEWAFVNISGLLVDSVNFVPLVLDQ